MARTWLLTLPPEYSWYGSCVLWEGPHHKTHFCGPGTPWRLHPHLSGLLLSLPQVPLPSVLFGAGHGREGTPLQAHPGLTAGRLCAWSLA